MNFFTGNETIKETGQLSVVLAEVLESHVFMPMKLPNHVWYAYSTYQPQGNKTFRICKVIRAYTTTHPAW